MIAKFYAQRIISGRSAFKKVPAILRKEVAQILDRRGHSDLIIE